MNLKLENELRLTTPVTINNCNRPIKVAIFQKFGTKSRNFGLVGPPRYSLDICTSGKSRIYMSECSICIIHADKQPTVLFQPSVHDFKKFFMPRWPKFFLLI